MSDHWKVLANLLGTPGPADPPETEGAKDEKDPVAAKASAPVAAGRPEKPPAGPAAGSPGSVRTTAAAQASRKKSSMWGDDLDSETVSEPTRPAAPPPATTTGRASEPLESRAVDDLPPVDALVAIVSAKPEAPVPGFVVPESQLPEPPQGPAKRSAWDTLIGTLGIKPAADPDKREPATAPSAAPPAARAAAPAAKEVPKKEARRPAESSFGAGLVDWDEEPGGSRQPTSRSESAEFLEDRPADVDADDDRPRGRGRRGGSRNRGRGGDADRQPDTRASADIGWDPEPVAAEPLRRAPADQDAGDRPRRSDERPAEKLRREEADEVEGEGDARRRRPRRRGQRQTLSASDVQPGRSASEPLSSRSESPSTQRPTRRDDVGAPRRDDAGGRQRPPRADRSETGRSDRASRSARGGEREEEQRGDLRTGRRRPEVDEPAVSDDESLEGFGGDLLAEAAPAGGGEDETRSRPRRRRGRRGRGGPAGREDDTQRPEEVSDEIGDEIGEQDDDTWAPVSELPGFDDDLEDDDEAEQIRRRSRAGRSRTRRDLGPGTRGDEPQGSVEPPSRSGDFEGEPRPRSVPTWLDTVTLLVDANIQRRASSGGSGSSRGQQGRGGRR